MSESMKEKWIMGVALTTTILAVCTAISSLRASSYSTKIQLATTLESNKWAHFQSKSIKEHSYRLQMEVFELNRLLGGGNPEVEKFIQNKVKEYDQQVTLYEKEKEDIKQEAEQIMQQEEVFKAHNSNFALAVMLLQIAILMSSVGALIKKKIMWFTGIGFGVFGLVYMINGFFLLY